MKANIRALIPKIDLPGYFHVVSMPVGGKTHIVLTLTIRDGLQPHTAIVDKTPPTLYDAVAAFPKVNVKNPLARGALASVRLPAEWVLECSPCQGKEGFRLSFDSGDLHWEKDLEVNTMRLGDLLELVEWVRAQQKRGVL